MSPSPLAELVRLKLKLPSPADKTADVDRLFHALKAVGYDDVTVPLELMRRLPAELRSSGFEVSLVIAPQARGFRLLDIGPEAVYGLAMDLGSTNIACALYDLATGEKLDELDEVNPQVSFGSDVLTRVQRAMTGEFDPLAAALKIGMNSLIRTICRKNSISDRTIYAMTVAGNTIMTHFFLGLEVGNIPLSPYTPVSNSPVFLSAGEAGLVINSRAVVYTFPNAGSYVGGDIISGIIFGGINREESPVLFVDVGTNVEVTLGCKDWIMTGAGAAGPALEGGVAAIGRKAEPGTINSVRIDPVSGEITVGVIDGLEPAGICGSGLIDLVSEMFSAGLIDQTGRFTDQAHRVVSRDGVRALALHRAGDKELFITEPEIRNFLVSKAAMFSFLYVFVRSVGLAFRDIKKVLVSGALGCGINPESAIKIGMLPDIPRERLVLLGNSSLGGAGMVLLDRGLLEEVSLLSSRVTYREMNEDSELMNILQGAIFIPHTEPELLKA